ncbi:YfiR family protein [candidate division KSB1 bacterium]|nr:MAG: YfiR family protein [candidate division KSB1 bacterium]
MPLRVSFIILVILCMTGSMAAQDIAVPIEVQYPLLLKVLTFDRNLKNRIGKEIVIGIVFQSNFKASRKLKDRLERVIQDSPIKTVEGIPIKPVAIDLDKTNLNEMIKQQNVDILYIAPLRAYAIGQISDISRNQKILTTTGVPDYVEAGLAVGVGLKGAKPELIINLPAVKNEGCDFSSQLLKLAKVIMK